MPDRPAIRTLQPDAVTTVHQRLEAGLLPWQPPPPDPRFAGMVDPGERWAGRRPGEGLVDVGPVTDPEGVVLDHLVYVAANRPTGQPHAHDYAGALITHDHADGDAPHAHHPVELGG